MRVTECIRRPTSVWTSCRCDDCRVHAARMAKLARNGAYRRVSSDDAWKVVDRLVARGWTGRAIASSAGIPAATVERAIWEFEQTGRRSAFGPTNAARIVNHGQPTEGMVGAAGARRRLRGLAQQGWDLTRLADLTGIRVSTLAQIRVGTTTRINTAKHNAIRAAVDTIGADIGPSVQGRRNAEQQGWHGLLAWDDIDDPTETPETHDAESAELQRWIDWWADRGFYDDDSVDIVKVRRVLAGEVLDCTPLERRVVLERAHAQGRSLNDIARQTGWKTERYFRAGEAA